MRNVICHNPIIGKKGGVPLLRVMFGVFTASILMLNGCATHHPDEPQPKPMVMVSSPTLRWQQVGGHPDAQNYILSQSVPLSPKTLTHYPPVQAKPHCPWWDLFCKHQFGEKLL